MSGQKQTAEAKTKQQHKPSVPQTAAPQSGLGDVLAEVPALSTVGSLDQQVAMLKRLPPAQKQALMGKIGQTQGNGHVQRLVASMRPQTPKPKIIAPPPVVQRQAQMEVNDPNDQYEQEADQVADAVMRMSTAAPPPPPSDDGDELPDSGASGIQAKGDSGGVVAPETAERINNLRGGGHPLPDGERQFFEERMGADFSGVRIHTGSTAVQASQEVQAKAFTTGSDIAFNEGEYRPGTESGRKLLAHELTHTMQQGAAQSLQRQAVRNSIGPVDAVSPQTESQLQRLSLDDVTDFVGDSVDAMGDAVGAGVDAVSDVAGDVMEMGSDAFMEIISTVAPGLAELIRNGPVGLIMESVEEGIQGWLSALFGDIDVGAVITELADSVGGVIATIQGVATGDPAACQAFSDTMGSIKEFITSFMDNPIIKRIQATFETVQGIFKQVSELVLAPIFDALMDVAGGVFNQVKGLATTITGWIGNVRDFMSAAWDWVLEQLGISGGGDEEGIWTWLKEQVDEVWDTVKETLQPILGPLQTVLGALLIFSPAGPIVVAVRYGPQLVEMIQWLWAHKDDPNIIEAAHEEMGDTILPQLLTGLQGFGTTFQGMITEFVGQVTAVSDGLFEFLNALAGIPLLSVAQNTVQKIALGVQQFASWASEGLQAAGESLVAIYTAVRSKLQPYIEVLTSLALAIGNPPLIPVILAGWAWRALDDCYKGPVINFLLDMVIGILRTVPDLPMLGLLWPMVKTGIIGFLEQIRAEDDDTKAQVTNRLAKIISGASVDFIFGFVKGLLKGLWEGLTDPFVLMYSAVKGLYNLSSWLYQTAADALSGDADEETTEIGVRMQGIGGEVEPYVDTISSGFMPAVEEFFTGGEGMSFEDLMATLGEAWTAVESAIHGAGGQLAEAMVSFFTSDAAEGKMGEGLGWLTGTIIFEVALGILTVGSYSAASGIMKVVKLFAKVLDWTSEVLGMAFKALSKLGGYLMDFLKALGKMLSNAGGAVRTIMDAIRELGERLIRYGQELLGMAARRGDEATGAVDGFVDDAAGAVTRGADDVAGGATRGADGLADDVADTAGEAGEQGARRADDLDGTPDFIEAKAMTAVAEETGVAASALVTTLKAKFSKHQFQAVPIAPGHHRIVMRANLDNDYQPSGIILDKDANPIGRPADMTAGADMARRLDWPDPPEGYSWVARNNRPVLGRGPNSELPPARYDPFEQVFRNKETDAIIGRDPLELINPRTGRPMGETPDLINPHTGRPMGETPDLINPHTGRPMGERPELINPHTNKPFLSEGLDLPCFPGDTWVHSPSGMKRIDSLGVGDKVLAFNFETGAVEEQKIAKVLNNKTNMLFEIGIGEETIRATGNHPFWIVSLNQWISARDLEPGMSLKHIDGHTVQISSMKTTPVSDYPTYNLSVTNRQNYFVGSGVLVHNQGVINYGLGEFSIYIGRNPAYPDRVYIGMTRIGVDGRLDQHVSEARRKLLNPSISPQDREFFTFKRNMRVEELASGLKNEHHAKYVEEMVVRHREAQEGLQVMNKGKGRITQETLERYAREIANDPDIKAAGYCR